MKCEYCGAQIAAFANRCSNCGKEMDREALAQDMGKTVFCTKCGEKNLENNFKCTRCGTLLHETAPPGYVVNDDPFGGLIPVKNKKALAAYYLSIFALLPFVGIPLGFAALIFGIQGVNYANQKPEVRGKVHAWIGIILGGLCAIGYTLALIALLAAS